MKRLVCLGDSITDAGRLFSPDGLGYGYVSLLNELANRQEKKWKIVNRGVDGFTVNRLAENVGRDCIDYHPDAVSVLIGVNDVCMMQTTGRTPRQQEIMLAEFGRTYGYLLETIRRCTGSSLILLEPFIFPWPLEYSNWIPMIREISGQIARLAEQYGCPYIRLHDRLNQAAETDGFGAITEDGIHLTSRGHAILANAFWDQLKRI